LSLATLTSRSGLSKRNPTGRARFLDLAEPCHYGTRCASGPLLSIIAKLFLREAFSRKLTARRKEPYNSFKMSLQEKLDKIRSPKLQNQHQVVLSNSAERLNALLTKLPDTHCSIRCEDTLRDQKTEPATGYFAALLALLRQAVSAAGSIKILQLRSSTSSMSLLHMPAALLRSKFSQILTILPRLTFPEADAPLLRPSIGCSNRYWWLRILQHGNFHNTNWTRRAMAGF